MNIFVANLSAQTTGIACCISVCFEHQSTNSRISGAKKQMPISKTKTENDI